MGTTPAGEPKTGVSALRNIIGLIVLLAVLVVGGLQVWAKTSYNSAVNALSERTTDETKDLLKIGEAETLIGHESDDAGREVDETFRKYLKKTYTWHGLLGVLPSYTITAYYTRGVDPRLHHFETDEKKYTPDAAGIQTKADAGAVPTQPMPKAAGADQAKEKSKTGSDVASTKSKSEADKAKDSAKKPADVVSEKAKTDGDKPKDSPKTGSDSATDKPKD
jgi:hypothetical protein